MKIKKIIDLCVKRGTMGIFTDPETEEQWMSDGIAIYPLEGLPYINKQYICAMYDITDKKAEKVIFREIQGLPDYLNLSDTVPNETEAEMKDISVTLGGATHVPILTEQGLMFVEGRHLAPLADLDSSYLQFYLRYNARNKPIITVKNGFSLVAMINPIIISDTFINELEELYQQTKVAYNNYQISEAKENEENTTRSSGTD